jgi:DNA-directed RNA polymerase subunit RPC12/RpoP
MVLFECSACHKSLRARDQDQGKRATCPCGMPAWIPGESMGFWLTLFDQLWEKKNWNCPGCNKRIPVDAPSCPECKKELPILVKP